MTDGTHVQIYYSQHFYQPRPEASLWITKPTFKYLKVKILHLVQLQKTSSERQEQTQMWICSSWSEEKMHLQTEEVSAWAKSSVKMQEEESRKTRETESCELSSTVHFYSGCLWWIKTGSRFNQTVIFLRQTFPLCSICKQFELMLAQKSLAGSENETLQWLYEWMAVLVGPSECYNNRSMLTLAFITQHSWGRGGSTRTPGNPESCSLTLCQWLVLCFCSPGSWFNQAPYKGLKPFYSDTTSIY